MRTALIHIGFLISLASGSAIADQIKVGHCQPDIVIGKELLITDPSVIDDPSASLEGDLSFSNIFKLFSGQSGEDKLTSEILAKQALLDWLGEWNRNQLDSGVPAVSRSTAKLKWMWPKDPDGSLSLRKAPFILSAIVYRPDLSGQSQISGKSIAGEMRFVFNLIDPANGSAKQFTTIFEFPLFDIPSTPSWVARFHDLGKVAWGKTFISELKSLISNLEVSESRLRTNDFFLAFEWDLREFRVGADHKIKLQPLPMTPLIDFNDGDGALKLSEWVNGHSLEINTGTYDLDISFQTANAFSPNEGFKWLLNKNISDPLRKGLSLHTCNGCHTGETMTRFTHIEARHRSGVSRISNFLSQDLLEREAIFERLICHDENELIPLLGSRKGRVH